MDDAACGVFGAFEDGAGVEAHPAATSAAGGGVSLAPLPPAGGGEGDFAPLPQAGGVGGGLCDAAADPAFFSRERQATFLAALAATGQVRSASARAGVSHQTAYRARLASPGFRRAWDAALLAARAQAEELLACRAMEGWEEDVIYHGEVVATRRRFSDRLLLAHLARLDKLCGDAEVAQFADAFDETLARFAAGEDRPAQPLEEPAEAGAKAGAEDAAGADGILSFEQWSMRSRQGEGTDAVPPPLPVETERGRVLSEAAQLDTGRYETWLEESGERMLTTWPAGADFAGEVFAVEEDSLEVIGAWPLDEGHPLISRCLRARTLSEAELDGLVAKDAAAYEHRMARFELYRRAAFGLASAAELASIAAANPAPPQRGEGGGR